MKIFKADIDIIIILLIMEFGSGFVNPNYFIIFAINLVLLLIQIYFRKE